MAGLPEVAGVFDAVQFKCEREVLCACCALLASSRCTVCPSRDICQIPTLCIYQVLGFQPPNSVASACMLFGQCVHALPVSTTCNFCVLPRCSDAVLCTISAPLSYPSVCRLPTFFPNPSRRCFLIPSGPIPIVYPVHLLSFRPCLGLLLLLLFPLFVLSRSASPPRGP